MSYTRTNTAVERTPQWKNGKYVEAWLDKYYRERGFLIWQTTPEEEDILCIGDRWFLKDKLYMVEYKSGNQTRYTGKVFVEIISNDITGKLGWALTSKADYLIYANLWGKELYIFIPKLIRSKVDELKQKFPVKSTHEQNPYKSHGILVPAAYAKQYLASKVVYL